MNRRTLLNRGVELTWGATLASIAGPLLGFTTASPNQNGGKEREMTAEEWMNAWMNRPADSQSPLVRAENGTLYLSRFVEPIYFLMKSIAWKPNPGQDGFSPVTVPVGFVSDLASIPRVFWSLLRPDGEYTYPAIVHDYLYWSQTGKREDADMILKMGMEDFKVATATINTIYQAVRVGGGASWKTNAQLRKAGEKRVLQRFPTDPTTRWKDWKANPNNFADL
jgi:hypothetical protein